jgi:hypothetical protein
MPVHPAEENATGSKDSPSFTFRMQSILTHKSTGITDQVAKESSDSTASSHSLHQVDTGATSGGSISAQQAFKANPGPVITENIGEPVSKEELKKRAEELNK